MKARHLLDGENAEQRARQYLQRRGLAFVEANYRCPPGEIDLVMSDGPTIVFVEVRYRRNQSYGGALESIDARKQRKLRSAAQHYLQRRHGKLEVPCRVDVVLVSGNIDDANDDQNMEWIPNAL